MYLGPEFELQWRLLLNILTKHFLLQLQPSCVALAVRKLETEEPNFSQSDGLYHLIEKLLSRGAGLDGKLQVCIHGQDPHVDLRKQRNAR